MWGLHYRECEIAMGNGTVSALKCSGLVLYTVPLKERGRREVSLRVLCHWLLSIYCFLCKGVAWVHCVIQLTFLMTRNTPDISSYPGALVASNSASLCRHLSRVYFYYRGSLRGVCSQLLRQTKAEGKGSNLIGAWGLPEDVWRMPTVCVALSQTATRVVERAVCAL